MLHIGVGRRRAALIIGDDCCGALLLRACMISPTKLPRCMGYTGNMPKKDIYLHNGDVIETKSSM